MIINWLKKKFTKTEYRCEHDFMREVAPTDDPLFFKNPQDIYSIPVVYRIIDKNKIEFNYNLPLEHDFKFFVQIIRRD